MTYIFGLDVGIASVGFSGKLLENNNVLFSGVQIFDTAEQPKTGASLAKPRRDSRGQRRVIRRRAQRKKNIRKLFLKYGFNKEYIKEIDRDVIENQLNVWQLRAEALNRKLNDSEFAKILFHIAKRRGFQSNSKKAESNDTEGKKALEGSKILQESMVKTEARTVGEYLSKLPKQKNGSGSYERFVIRTLLREEIKIIFKDQQKFKNDKATDELQKEYEEIAFTQRPLQSSEKLVGTCFLEKSIRNENEKRAPKFSYSAELFVLWSKLNNLRIKEYSGNERALTQDEKNQIADIAHKNKDVKYKKIRDILELDDEERFNISYRKTDDKETDWEKIKKSVESRTVFMSMKGYHALKRALGVSENDWQSWIGSKIKTLDDIAKILSFNEDNNEIKKQLSNLNLNENEIESLLKITDFKKSIDISAKAARKILPFMQQGMTYDKACDAAGYNFNKLENKNENFLPKFDTTRNPVVDRSLSQVRKVINAVIRKHGMPDTFIIEIANDLGKSRKDRNEIDSIRAKNQKNKESAKKHMEEIIGREPNGTDIIKHRLWKEQNGYCPYSGEYIEEDLLKDPLATQIDHILPHSRSYDNSYMNKVLCFTDENQRKGNKTPYEYLKGTKNWEAIEGTFAKQLPRPKAERLLTKDFDASKEGKWKERHLNDTRYITKLLKNHIEQNLDLGKGKRVQTRNGRLTAHLRAAWGFPDKNRENDRHHALDAIVLTCSTESMVQKLTSWNKYEARKRNPEKRPLPPLPWEGFREDALKAVEGIFVSRMPNRKITGQAHQEKIRSIRHDDNGKQYIVQRKPLTSLSKIDLENIVDKEGRNENLYNILKARLDEHSGDIKKAFIEPIKLIDKNGEENAAVINSIRVITNEKSGVEINGGLASNGDMIRVDVFKKSNKFYLCPIYAHHVAQGKLPTGLIKAKTDEKDWPQIDDSYEFKFSLYKNDLVRIKNKKGEEHIGYYKGVDRAVGTVGIIAHDHNKDFGKNGLLRTGVQGLDIFEKYVVNYFGERFKVKGEKRLDLAKPAHTKSGKTVTEKCATSTRE